MTSAFKRYDRGASMVLVAFTLLLLLGAAAIAVDLAAIRLDRSADQKVTDSAASAGAITAVSGTPVQVCEAALAYVEVNAQELGLGSVSGASNCGLDFIDLTCDPAAPRSHLVSVGRYDVTVIYPVINSDDLMTSGQLGASGQSIVPDDGEPCERVGVEMTSTHDSFFAQLLGFDQGTTTVHTVATAFLPGVDGPPLNLLVLDRSGCDAILVRGQGGVIVDKVTDPATGDEFPGIAATDSDAGSGCIPSVLHAQGQGLLRADGPDGCANEVTPGTGEGCGFIRSLAPGVPGCNNPACQIDGANARIIPDLISMSERITRAQIDYEYNCWPDYANPPAGVSWAVGDLDPGTGQDISGCTTGDPDHIYDLINAVGSSGNPIGLGSWSRWTAAGHPCLIATSDPDIFETGNWVIDCPTFTVRRHVEIQGNVVFDGNVNITGSSGHLDVANSLSSPGWAFFRDPVHDPLTPTLTKDGQAHLTFDFTMVYMARHSQIAMSGGSGTLTWIAPDSGDFDDLGLWSDSPHTQFWAGQANLTMEGVFFTPWARANYSGTSGQNQTDAQWVAHSLEAHGQGVLKITPKFEFPLKADGSPRTTIIR